MVEAANRAGERIDVMVERRKPISFTEAVERIFSKVQYKNTEAERLPLEQSGGRILAEPVVAKHPVPWFDRSPYDGYAIRAEDTEAATRKDPVQLQVIESIGAGFAASRPVGRGQAVRIMTGAPIPEGADAVIMLELVHPFSKNGQDWIQMKRKVKKGDNISWQGEDTEEGSILAEPGRRIGPGEMAMLATFGCDQVSVYRPPVIGVLATGSELIPPEAPLQIGKIRNSNSYMLMGQIAKAGAKVKYYGIVPDQYETCRSTIKQALTETDIVITTGGASVGDFDYIGRILRELGADLLFDKVAMRPGSVTTVACKENQWIFGLSGNPSACYVGFELFARPVIQAMLGAPHPHLPRGKAVLSHTIEKPNPFTRFIRGKAIMEGSTVTVGTVGMDKSGIASSLVEANVLIVAPGGTRVLPKGELIDVIWLRPYNDGTIT